jgi:photosystem II stability/assembly factor-like uncharacterized protein
MATGLTGTYKVSAIAVDPANSSVLYAGTTIEGSVFKSADAGGSWTVLDIGPAIYDCHDIAIDPNNTGRVYVGGEGELTSGIVNGPDQGGVYLSENAGATWGARNEGMTNFGVIALIVNPSNPSLVYAGTDIQHLGFFVSADGGNCWAGRTPPASTAAMLSLVANPQDPSRVYAGGLGRSSNIFTISGTSLDYLCGPGCFGFDGGYVNALVAASDGDGIALYFGTDRGIFKSTDQGGSWFSASSGLTNTNVLELVGHPDDPSTLYAGTQGGVFKSSDSGASWSLMNSGIGVQRIDALAIDPTDPAILYAGTDSGFYRSMNEGSSWVASNSGLSNLKIQAIAVNPEQPTMVYIGTPDGVFRSIDHGATWKSENDGLYFLNVSAIAIDPVTPSTIYIGTGVSPNDPWRVLSGAGIFKSQ